MGCSHRKGFEVWLNPNYTVQRLWCPTCGALGQRVMGHDPRIWGRTDWQRPTGAKKRATKG